MILRAAAALGATVLLSQTMTPPRRVTPAPERVGPGLISRTMAEADAQSFARALAEAGHAAGFIMPTSERQVLLPPDAGHMLTLDEAIEAFSARRSYRVIRQGAALVFQHAKAPPDIVDALEAPQARPAVRMAFSSVLFGIVLRNLARRSVGGVVGAEPGAGPECPVERVVTLPAGRGSTIDTLNRLVAQTKGVAWLVRFGLPGDGLRLQLGYVCGNGVWSAMSVPGW